MAVEIERKFLVTGDAWRSGDSTYYCQGYLNTHQDRTVRVRIAGDKAFLTNKSFLSDTNRLEFEYPIPVDDAQQMLKLCDQPPVEKNRFIIPHVGFEWEVDEFLGANAGLIVAEIELESSDQSFEKPDWIGEEVTDDPRYLNSHLTKKPFSEW